MIARAWGHCITIYREQFLGIHDRYLLLQVLHQLVPLRVRHVSRRQAVHSREVREVAVARTKI